MEAHQTSNLGVLGSSPSKVVNFFLNYNNIRINLCKMFIKFDYCIIMNIFIYPIYYKHIIKLIVQDYFFYFYLILLKVLILFLYNCLFLD